MLAYCSIDAISLCCKHFLMWQFYRPLWFVWADIWANTLSPLQNSPCTFCTLCTLSLSPLQNCIVKTNSLRHMCWCTDSRKASHFRRSSVDTFYYWCYFTAPILKTTLVCQAVVTQTRMHWALYKTHCVHWALYKITLCTPQRRIELFTKLTQPPMLGPWPLSQQCTMHIVQSTLYTYIHLTPASTRVWGL